MTLLLVFFLLTSGMLIADYSVNVLLKNENKIGFIEINNLGNYSYEVNLVGNIFYVDARYLTRDFNELKSILTKHIN